jgi:nucleoside 2-deoxyribosyltransferase
MKVIYIAGRFRGATAWDIAENVRAAERAGLRVARAGAMPLIPHANTANFHGEGTDEFWLEGTLELMRRCDAVYVFDPSHHNGPNPSQGTVGEVREAFARGIPVFVDFGALAQWIRRAP